MDNFSQGIKDKLKEFKKNGFAVEFQQYEDVWDELTLSKDGNHIFIELIGDGAYIDIRTSTTEDKIEKALMDDILAFVALYEKEIEKEVRLELTQIEGVANIKNAKRYLKDKGYEGVKKEKYYMKKGAYKKAEKEMLIYEEYLRQIEELEEYLPVFEFWYTGSNKFENSFYYHGFEGLIGIKRKNNNLFIYIKKEDEEKENGALIDKKENVKDVLENLMDGIEKKQRIKNILEEPKYYFSQMLGEMCSLEKEDKEFNELYNLLRGKYDQMKIESISSMLYKSGKYNYTEFDRYNFTFIFDKTLVYINQKEETVNLYKPTKESAKKIMKNIYESAEEKLIKSLEGVEGK